MFNSISSFRFGETVTLLASVLVSVCASGQIVADDAFVQMRTNMGEQMTPYGSDRYLNEFGYGEFGEWSRSMNFGRPSVIPFAPPALGQEFLSANAPQQAIQQIRPAKSRRPLENEFAREIFYPAYTSIDRRNQFSGDQFSGKDLDRVTAYRTARRTLLQEIHAKFDEVQNDPPARRAAALAELADRQAERLRALEADAEVIRARTAWVGTISHLDDTARPLLRLFEAAYFFDGLSTDQRLLLTEIAYENHAFSFGPSMNEPNENDGYIYFLPATARIRLPAKLPAALDQKIQAFLAEKGALKKELRDAAMWADYFFARQRTQRFVLLAQQQAPRFAALYKAAEEIRTELANFPYPDMPGQVDLPADLTQRVGVFMAGKVETQREVLRQLGTLRHKYGSAQFDIARQGDGLAIVQTGADEKTVAVLAGFNTDLARRYTAFAHESEILRRDIQHYTEAGGHSSTRSVDQLAADFANSYAAQKTWNRYRDYFRAVMVPGLSPAQRRLLYQSALVELEQPEPPASS